MSRVVLVSNRVLDLRKAAQAGGVAVALADIVRTRPSLWFGWNGEIKPAEEANVVDARRARRHRAAHPGRARPVLSRLLQFRAVAGVSQPPGPCAVRGRLLRAVHRRQPAPRRAAAADAAARRHHLGARLPSDPAGDRAAQARRAEPHRLLPAHSVPALADVHCHSRARASRALPGRLRSHRPADEIRRGEPHRLHGQQRIRQRPVGRAHQAVRPDRHRGGISHRHRCGGFRQPEARQPARAGTRREPHRRRRPARLYEGPAAEVQGLRAVPGEESPVSRPGGADADRAADPRKRRSLSRHPPGARKPRRLHQRPLRRARLGAHPLHPSVDAAPPAGRHLPLRPHRHGHAAARRHEPGRQGVCRRPGPRGSRRAHSVALCRRRRGAGGGADRQSLRHRSDRPTSCAAPWR